MLLLEACGGLGGRRQLITWADQRPQMWGSELDIEHWITTASPSATLRSYDDLLHRAAMKSASRVAALLFDVASQSRYEPGSIQLAASELDPDPEVFLDPTLQFLLAEASCQESNLVARRACAAAIVDRARTIPNEPPTPTNALPWFTWRAARRTFPVDMALTRLNQASTVRAGSSRRLSPAPLERPPPALIDAVRLLNQCARDGFGGLNRLLRAIVPIATNAASAATLSSLPGVVFVRCDVAEPAWFAEQLIQELSHTKLILMNVCEPLFSELCASEGQPPWRRDMTELWATLRDAFAFWHVLRIGLPLWSIEVRARLARDMPRIKHNLHILCESADDLTPFGSLLAATIYNELRVEPTH